MLGRQVLRVLLRVVHNLFTFAVPEADTFNIFGVARRVKFEVATELDGHDHVGLSARAVRVDGDGLVSNLDCAPVLLR